MKCITLLVFLMVLLAGSCTNNIEETVVQVWEPSITTGELETLVAFGVSVGDGNQVLTVLNYEDYVPGNLEVVLPGYGRFNALVQAIDPRTGATLLRLEGANLPVATLGDINAIKPGQSVFIHGWSGSENNFKKTPATISSEYNIPLYFKVYITQEALESGGWINEQGALVTDSKGRALGLVGTFYNKLIPMLMSPGWIPPVVRIDAALELLSPDVAQQPWANGPVISTITDRDGARGYTTGALSSGVLSSLSSYEDMTVAIQDLLTEIGEPLAGDDLPQNYRNLAWPMPGSADGTLLTVVYVRPIELRDADDELLAQAKWVGIQWRMSEGKPNRLFYGQEPYTVDGGFVLSGDVTSLENSLR
jgi:hypothetical protein